MEPLFRLTLRRPPVVQDPANPSIPTAQDSQLQKDLTDASTAFPDHPREALQRIARSFVAGTEFIGAPDANPLNAELGALATALDDLEGADAITHAKVVTVITGAFGRSPEAVAGDNAVVSVGGRLRDSIVAIKLLPEEHGRPIEALANQLRDLELVSKVAADSTFPASRDALTRYRRRSLSLPPLAELKPVLSTEAIEGERRKQRAEAEAARQKQIETLLATHQGLAQAVRELSSLGGEHLQATPQEAHAGFTPPPDLSANIAAARASAYYQKLTDLNLKQLEGTSAPSVEADAPKLQDIPGTASATVMATQLLASAPRPPAGSPAFSPLTLGDVAFRLNSEAVNALSPTVREMLAQRQVRLDQTPLDQVVRGLQVELNDTATKLGTLQAQAMTRNVVRVGDTTVTITRPLPSAWTDIFVGGAMSVPWPLPPAPLPPVPQPAPESIPHTRGKVTPAGIADLLIVKQQLIDYETADIAHIENVLKGESKVREHTTRQEIQQLTFQEAETTKSEERELQSTDRYEMTRETSNTIKEDAALKAGLTLSGKYGPTVDFSASAEGATSRSKEEATKTAATYSEEVTQRSAKKVTERVLQRTSLTVTDEVIEKNTHTLDNTGGTGHISGVYQWVNKVYQAQMFNYGLRTMFDFMVPEPAAFYIAAQKAAEASASSLQKPPEFTLTPDDVSEANYPYWVRLYHATDVAPPPELFITKAFDFKAGGGDENTDYNHSGQITIDEGYLAIQGTVGRVVNTWGDEDLVDVVFGRHSYRFAHNSPWIWSTPLDGEVDTIPFAMDTFKASMIAIAVEVRCRRTDRATAKWRLETHAKLTAAYQARLSEYEEKLSAAKLQAGIPISGKNPALNLELMKDELKKHCISILTDQSYDLFDAIETSATNGLPQVDVAEAGAEGAYVRFFEQAFEWEEMTWVTYPYFWGRKSQWSERLTYEDPDPVFNEFLKAGYCRVAVPARPGFEGAIDHFMTLGELWNGGSLPPISSPLYLPIADEIAEHLQRPGDEVPQGEPWQVRIPTTLVKLRVDDALPSWTQDASGDWVEA
jgi:hypothetical protein